ncbi:hypothetical protein BKA70DRAFT_1235616 [Coprinopsis sp. MPI-PUGE-AT-0042]|nr:hypothetical protein BKA70DRAFT_1235616 [Coprinopsis sp. MPI-PUGE-AT-0042]
MPFENPDGSSVVGSCTTVQALPPAFPGRQLKARWSYNLKSYWARRNYVVYDEEKLAVETLLEPFFGLRSRASLSSSQMRGNPEAALVLVVAAGAASSSLQRMVLATGCRGAMKWSPINPSTNHRGLVPKDFSSSQLAASSASVPDNRSPSPLGTDSSLKGSPAPSPMTAAKVKGNGKGKAQGKKHLGKAKPATQGDSKPVSTSAPPSQKHPAGGTQCDPIVIADSEGKAVPEVSTSASVDVDEGPSCSTSLGNRTNSVRSRSEGEDLDDGAVKCRHRS